MHNNTPTASAHDEQDTPGKLRRKPCIPLSIMGTNGISKASLGLLFATLLDAALGEPPTAVHPVIWMGRWLSYGRKLAPVGNGARFIFGMIWLFAGCLLSAVAGWLAKRLLGEGVALWTVIAWRALWDASGEVEAALRQNNLEEARRLLAWHLVSRDTTHLSETEVAESAIESIAENLTDSYVAPLMAYAVGGVPLAWAYRFLNTADAMWGYRDAEREWLGKSAARLDDAANWLPARFATLLLILLGGSNAARTAWHEQHQTPSPNGGWTMAAMAGALHTTLRKPDVYALRGGEQPANGAMIGEARWLLTKACVLTVVVVALMSGCSEYKS